MRNLTYVCTLVCVVLFVSCSSTKYVPEGGFLLDDVNVKIERNKGRINVGELRSYVRQQGNSRWFSTFKVPLGTYSLAGRDSTKWINRALKSMGEPPVLYDSVKTKLSCRDLRSKMFGDGFLDASVYANTSSKGKKIDVTYIVNPGGRYSVRNVRYDIKDSVIAEFLGRRGSLANGLRPRMLFSITSLDQERKRIVDILVNNGYYRFNKDFISYNADTLSRTKEVDITLILNKYRANNSSDETLHKRYRIGTVFFQSGDVADTVIHLRKRVLDNNTFIEPSQFYSSRELQKTYNHFGRLQAVKYTNISFREQLDSALLNCRIQISTNKPSTISFQPEGTNTAGDFGAAATLAYQNRNLFHGSELLSLEFRGAYEAIRGLEGYANDNFEEYGAEARLLFPRFIAPFLPRQFRRRITATSEVSLSYNLQNRPEYHRRVLSAAWKYKWNDANHHDKYQVDLLDLNYVSMPWISNKFKTDYLDDVSNRNAILRYNYENLFIMKFGFGYSYNNKRYVIKSSVETAGNLLNLFSHTVNASRNELGMYKLFNIAFAQYVKCDFEYTGNWNIDYNNALVFHLGLGLAYPYGNSTILPFEKRYFSGGANSVRGWNVRSLGPGRYVEKDGNINFINQTGDMKIDVNVEYRAHLFWKINGALFVDAGNIWTLRDYPEQPGGQFRFNEFLKEMAVGYGMGLRFNFDYFILRFDFGMKAVNPVYETRRQHYPVIHPKLSRDLTFHFAVGLPF